MDVKVAVIVVFALCCIDFSYAKKGGGKMKKHRMKEEKKKERQTNKASIMGVNMLDMKEQLENLKEQVEKMPRNVVHIHMHDGHADEIHHHINETEETNTTDEESDYHHHDHHHDGHHESHDDEQHIHMHMHLESDCDHHGHHRHHHDEEIHAHCEVVPNSKLQDADDVTGQIHFIQKGDDPVDIFIKLSGFDMTKENAQHFHGFHVHTYGDMSESCESLGKHYNPSGTYHAAKDSHSRHVGDLGNIACDMNGNVDHHMTDDKIFLHGKNSLIGRSIAIHHGPDDMGLGGDAGSLSGGNAGPKIACCIIALADPERHQHHEHTGHETGGSHDHGSGHASKEK